jgi:hypothetical protein
MGSLRQVESSAQYAATSEPFFGGNVSARLGGLAEEGHQQTDVRLPMSLETLTASRVNALKLYGGLDSRLPENVLSASFGLEIGSTGFFSHPWRKFIGDVRHEYWHTFGDHHLFDLESRVTAGGIQFDSQIPLTERFFGGSYEQMFVPDDSWQIRANPVIRAIPGSRLYETAAGAGATNFLGVNLTAAIGIWRSPLVPAELNKDKEFQSLLEAQLKTATSMAQLHYSASDEHFHKMVAELPGVIGSIKSLQGAVAAVETAHSGLSDAFKPCKSAMNIASRRATDSQSGADYQQYGRISALLKADPHEDRLDKVISACGSLNTSLGADAGLTGPLNAVDQERQTLETEFKGIDQTAAAAKAKAEMAFVRRTLKTLFKDMNLYSISPVFIFDTVRIGPTGPGVRAARYGPGGGMRLELANSVNFTVGYAPNVSPGPGEGSNAVFFTIGVRDLFH